MSHKVLVILGPTASGKSAVALEVAERLGGEIISADAVAVYRGLDIGAAKPTPEERRRVRHHLLDVVRLDEDFNAARFAELARRAAEDILDRGRRVVLAGGSGLYLRAFLGGLFPAPPVDRELRASLKAEAERDPEGLHRRLAKVDPAAASRIEPRDSVRVTRALEVFSATGRPISVWQEEHAFGQRPFEALKLGLSLNRQDLARRIEVRTDQMLAQGWLEEVAGLLGRGADPQARPLQSIGYKQIAALLRGELNLSQARSIIIKETKRLAKRQMTWFRADKEIVWLPAGKREAFVERAGRFWEAE